MQPGGEMNAPGPGAPPSTAAPTPWRLLAVLAACGVFALIVLVAVIGAGAYFLSRSAQQPPAAQTAPARPVPAGAPQPAVPAPQVPPTPSAQAPAGAAGTYFTGHVYDVDTGKAIILAYVAVLRPGTDPASDWGKQQGALLAIGGTTDTTGSFQTKSPVPKGAIYPVLVFNVDSNVITQYANVPAGAPDIIDLGTFRLKMAHAQGASPAAAPASAGVQRFSDPAGRFTIDLPTSWKVQKPPQGAAAAFLKSDGLAAVQVHSWPYAGGAEEGATENEAAYLERHPTAKQVQGGHTQIGGRDAYYVYLTETTSENVDVYEINVFVADGQRLFMVDGAAWNHGSHVRDDFPVILQIIQSFRLR